MTVAVPICGTLVIMLAVMFVLFQLTNSVSESPLISFDDVDSGKFSTSSLNSQLNFDPPLPELLELFVPILETIATEEASPGFEVNWQKTKVQALGCREDMPLTIKFQRQDVMVVEEFVYLGSLIHSSIGSTCDISRRSAIIRAAMQNLENQIWRSS